MTAPLDPKPAATGALTLDGVTAERMLMDCLDHLE